MACARIGFIVLALCALLMPQATPAFAQGDRVVAHTGSLGRADASLTFELTNGRSLTIGFARGEVLVDGAQIGQYRPGGALESAWRDLVGRASELSTGALLAAVAELGGEQLDVGDRPTFEAVVDAVGRLPLQAAREAPVPRERAAELPVAPIPPIPDVPELPQGRAAVRAPRADQTLAEGEASQRMEAAAQEVAARAAEIAAQALELSARGLEEATRELDQELGSEVGRGEEVMPVRVQPRASGSAWGDMLGNAMQLLATFFGLALMGFGMLFFAPRQLEAVADTVWHRFWRSFLTGLFAQPLVVPVFGMMLVGLALTVVGILLIPFAAAAFVVALALAIAGGYVAMARTVGEIYVRRKSGTATAQAGSWVALRYIAYGLAGLLAVWLPPVLLGWVPVLGDLALVFAALITWFIATAGFGATILTRGGLRGTIVRRLDRALSDEHYWPSAGSPAIAERSARSRGTE